MGQRQKLATNNSRERGLRIGIQRSKEWQRGSCEKCRQRAQLGEDFFPQEEIPFPPPKLPHERHSCQRRFPAAQRLSIMTEPAERARRDGVISALLMRHRTALFAYIYSCVPHSADAEDILQEVSLTATLRFEQLREEAGFLPWAIEIARRQILAHRRKASRRTVLDPEVVSALASDAVETALQDGPSRRAEALLRCLESLPAHSVDLILARYDESFTTIESLAQRLQRTVSAT
jgi:RNA polymerase sigma-70 factor, ECF subfamily